MKKRPAITERPYATAEELVNALTSERDPWPADEQVCYRGQSDAAWGLIPNAARPECFDPFDHRLFAPLLCETATLKKFVEFCDATGLDTAGGFAALDTVKVRKIIGAAHSTGASHWPPKELHATLALAQHYGLPTRLLDWSLEPLIAAYFAARGAVKGQKSGGKLAVWTLKYRHLELESIARKWVPRVNVVRVPRASANQNLHAQAGLFTLVRGETIPPLEEVVLANQVRPRLLWKAVMPRAEAPALMKRLAGLGVTAASVFPGYKGVVEAMKEQRLVSRAMMQIKARGGWGDAPG